jgi:hypothetical protein
VTTKLELLNAALLEIGQHRLSDTGENVVSGRELNYVYSNVISDCLSVGSWNFATETIKAEADTGIEPEFGYSEVFAKPSDWVRTVSVSTDEYLTLPLLQYYDDANFWSADTDPIYVRYVSDDTGMGLELTRWTPAFRRYVELELASRVCFRLTQNSSEEEKVGKKRDKARRAALNQDAMNEPNPKFPPQGSWNNARSSSHAGEGRRPRTSLTG